MDNPATVSGVYLALATRFTTHKIKILDTDPLTTDPVLANQTFADELIDSSEKVRVFAKFLKDLVPDGAIQFVDQIPFAPDMTFLEARKLVIHALIAGSVPSVSIAPPPTSSGRENKS